MLLYSNLSSPLTDPRHVVTSLLTWGTLLASIYNSRYDPLTSRGPRSPGLAPLLILASTLVTRVIGNLQFHYVAIEVAEFLIPSLAFELSLAIFLLFAVVAYDVQPSRLVGALLNVLPFLFALTRLLALTPIYALEGQATLVRIGARVDNWLMIMVLCWGAGWSLFLGWRILLYVGAMLGKVMGWMRRWFA